MTLLKGNDYKDINVALLSLEADIKNKITNFDTSVIDKQLAEINSRIDKINAGGNNTSAQINDIRYEIEDINSKVNGNSAKIENIEQKLTDIFSAESKVTDFNTTTNSGIYYWVTDAANRPSDYGVLLVNKYDDGQNSSIWVNQIAYGTNNKIYFRQNINSAGWTEWKAVAFTTDIKNTTTKTFDLNTVSSYTAKYIKLGTFHWYDKASLKCRLYGNSFEDDVNINILSGNAYYASVCGYYSTNSRRTQAIIVKRGDNWNSDIEIYLQVSQATTLSIDVTIDEKLQDRINISESTTAPSGTLEEIVFNNINGMFTNNIDAKNLTGTAKKVANALTVNGKTYDGSSAVDAGVQTVANGGTGATTAKGAFMTLANGLIEGLNPEDTEQIIFKNSSGKDWGLYKLSHFWEYIKGKISSVLGLTKDNYGGKAATATSVEDGNNVIQYKAASLNGYKIQDTQEKALYVEGRELDNGDSGGIAITNDCVTAFGAGDTDGVFRVINEDNVSAGPVFKVMKDGQVYTTNTIHGSIDGSASNAGTADSLFYRLGNEINFKGGAPASCWFNYRNADTGDPSPVATMEYRFGNYSGDTTKSVLMAGSFDGTTAKASSKMVIPIGAPSSLEDGCIWIER